MVTWVNQQKDNPGVIGKLRKYHLLPEEKQGKKNVMYQLGQNMAEKQKSGWKKYAQYEKKWLDEWGTNLPRLNSTTNAQRRVPKLITAKPHPRENSNMPSEANENFYAKNNFVANTGANNNFSNEANNGANNNFSNEANNRRLSPTMEQLERELYAMSGGGGYKRRRDTRKNRKNRKSRKSRKSRR